MNNNNSTVIDVREKDEQPFVDEFEYLQIPLNEIVSNQNLVEKENVVVFCQSGNRSLQAAQLLNELFNDKHIYSLKGGIVEWKKQHALQDER